MQLINEEKINEIRNSADIVSVISDYVTLTRQGKNYFGRCPFHDDHKPSMSVSKERQLFKCFVCGKGGNVFNFIQNYENVTFMEAVKKVADRVGIYLDINPGKTENTKFQEEYEIMDFTTKILQNNLNSKEGIKAKEYLAKRNIDENIIKEFRIGYAINDNTYLYNVLTKKNYSLNKLDDLGLINKDGLKGYDKFINRIMIPITNLENKVVGFTGRIFNGEDTAKYINTKETIIYKKGNILFNYYNAKNYIRENKCAILVEGNMDAIRMYSSGIKNVLALMGTAITKEQVEILKKLRVPIVLMLDNDDAGNLATLNVGSLLVANNVPCQVIRLSGSKDPDEYIVNFGVDALKEVLTKPLSFLDFRLQELKNNKNLENTEELIKYVKEVIKLLANEDNLTKEITLKKISDDYNLDYELLKQEITFNKEEPAKEVVVPKVVENKDNKYQICVYNILYYMMCDSKYLTIFNKKLGYLKNKEERDLVTEIEYFINKYGKINMADFLTYLENYDNLKDLVNNITKVVSLEILDEKTFLEYINALDRLLNRENIKNIKNKIKRTSSVDEQLENINKQILLQKKMLEVKKEV